MSGNGQQHEEEVLEIFRFHARGERGPGTLQFLLPMVRGESLDHVRQLHLVLQRESVTVISCFDTQCSTTLVKYT